MDMVRRAPRRQLSPADPHPRVLFVAFGTRGDVQPLLLLARQLQRQHAAVVTFVTHDSMRSTFGWEGSGPAFVGTPTDAHRAPTGAGEVADEYEPVVRCVEYARPSLLVLNLFALGAWHVAEAFDLRCVVASPCLIPYAPPASLADEFRSELPQLYAELQRPPSASRVSWLDITHWMWPLWNDARWGSWRESRLGLVSPPLATRVGRLPPPTPVLYGFPALLLPPLPDWPAAVQLTSFWTAAPCDCEVVAPGAVDCAALLRHGAPLYVGFGSASALSLSKPEGGEGGGGEGGEGGAAEGGEAAALAQRLLRTALRAAASLGSPLLLHCCGARSLRHTWEQGLAQMSSHKMSSRELSSRELSSREPPALCVADGPPVSIGLGDSSGGRVVVQLVGGALDLASLLPRCTAALHHGGAGTCAAALLAGTPQLWWPCFFDQAAWAERLEHQGVGARLCSAELDRASLLHATLRRATDATARRRCALLAAALAAEEGEGGVPSGVHEAARHLASCLAPCLAPSLTLQADGATSDVAAAAAAREEATRGKAAAASEAAPAGGGKLLAAARLWAKRRRTEVDEIDEVGEVGEIGTGPERSNKARGGAGLAAEAAGPSLPPSLPASLPASLPLSPQRLRLPDGTSLWCLAPAEALHVHLEVVERRVYLPSGSGMCLPSSGLVVDGGANLGVFSLWVARRRPAVQLLALEPAPRSFELLRRNLEEAGLGCRVAALPLALASEVGEVQLTFYPHMPGNASLWPAEKWAERDHIFAPQRHAQMFASEAVGCTAVTLPGLLRARGLFGRRCVALLKLDVEHHEVSVLEGLRTEEEWAAVDAVVVETHTRAKAALVLKMLRAHFAVVGARRDDCELPEHAIVFAYDNRHSLIGRSPTEGEHPTREFR